MRPGDVVNDPALLLRFRDEVAYRDRQEPPAVELRDDTDVLCSKDGILVIAWYWPTADGEGVADPFEDARGSMREDSASRLRLLLSAVDRRIGSPEADLETHLVWSVPLTRLDLERLLRRDAHVPFRAIVQICRALQVTFTHAWEIEDPQRLDRRVKQSALASRIADGLHHLTMDNLLNLEKKLPRSAFLSPMQAEVAQDVDTVLPPEPEGRYRPLYEALAADNRVSPTYSVAEINRLLSDGDVPDSATDPRKGRSWWAGSGTKTAGRPQVQAWWAAGYRVRRADLKAGSADSQTITFEALPERERWLCDPNRPTWSEYRVAGPRRVRLDLGFANQLEELAGQLDHEKLRAELSSLVRALEVFRHDIVPEDRDIRILTAFLDEVGETDRADIERNFGDVWKDPVRITNLLTRARRQGWIVNKGTRRQPRWAATRKRALMIAAIADQRNLLVPSVDPMDPVPAEFLRQVAATLNVVPVGDSSVEAARAILQALNREWEPRFASADGSITSLGLQAMADAMDTVWRSEWDDPQ